MVSAPFDNLDMRMMLVGERGIPQQQLRVAQNAVQRRAEFMAHGGKKFCFRAVARVCRLFRNDQLCFDLFLRGDIEPEFQRHFLAVRRRKEHDIYDVRLPRRACPLQHFLRFMRKDAECLTIFAWRLASVQMLVTSARSRLAEQFFETPVGKRNAVIFRLQINRRRKRVQDGK